MTICDNLQLLVILDKASILLNKNSITLVSDMASLLDSKNMRLYKCTFKKDVLGTQAKMNSLFTSSRVVVSPSTE